MPASNLCWSRKGSGRLTWSSASAGSCTGSLTPATKWKQHRGWEATRIITGATQTRPLPRPALFVGKWWHLLAVDDDGTDQLPLLEHRHVEITSRAGAVDKGDYAGITLDVSLVHREVGNVEHLFVSEKARERAVRMF